MGWEFTREYLDKSRKQIVKEHVEWEYCGKTCKVIYAVEKGSTVYMAVECHDSETGYTNVVGMVALTTIRSKEDFNFGIKLMDETMLPNYYQAPRRLLDMLTPTDDEWALEWRKRCRKQYEETLQYHRLYDYMHTLPYGTILQLGDRAKTLIELFYFRGKLVYKIVDRDKRISLHKIMKCGFTVVSVGKNRASPAEA